MLGSQIVINRRSKDEAEKPFWISFADLMTALMILFLVVMSVALLAVTQAEQKEREARERAEGTINDQERVEEERDRDIDQLLITLAKSVESEKCLGAKVDRERRIIDFGSQALFPHSKHQLDPKQEKHLRECVPEILAIASNELGKKWIKRIVVEGYTSTRGTYLYNLNLSLPETSREISF
jgi:outer membrane protein OmpA-like peptidoglycan-associated protein